MHGCILPAQYPYGFTAATRGAWALGICAMCDGHVTVTLEQDANTDDRMPDADNDVLMAAVLGQCTLLTKRVMRIALFTSLL